jgi:hypothetical protein
MLQEKHLGFDAQCSQKNNSPPSEKMTAPDFAFLWQSEHSGHVVEMHFSEQKSRPSFPFRYAPEIFFPQTEHNGRLFS